MKSLILNKNLVLFGLFITLALHTIREEFVLYYPILIFFFLCACGILIMKKNLFKNLNLIKSLYLIFLTHLVFICFYTFYIFYSIPDFTNWFTVNEILVSIGRCLLMPSMAILIFNLYSNTRDFDNTGNFFIIVMCIGTITLIFQQIFGGSTIFGYWSDSTHRFPGMAPYSSSVGNKVVYGAILAMPIILAALSKSLHVYSKIVIFILIITGCFLTMQKAGLINLFLVFSIIFFVVDKKILKKLLLLSIISIFLTGILFPKISFNALSLIVNTTGIELAEDIKHENIYQPITKRFIDRLGLTGRWLVAPESSREFLFGWGNFGGTAVLGFKFDTDGTRNQLGTKHNQYLDLYQQGGILFLLNFIIFIFALQFQLLKRWVFNNDNFAKAFFICNCFFMLNCLVANGLIYHPIGSFIFWVSVTYMVIPTKNLYKI